MRCELSDSTLRITLLAAWAAHLGIALAVAPHHEPWRDEADVWLLLRDGAVSSWWSYFRHSGSPGLWHLMLAPIVRAGLPYVAMTYLNVGIVSIGVAIFLRWAPLPLPLKILLPFGVFPLHEYGVVARSYGLSFTLLMAVCAVFGMRRSRPIALGLLLALLANTNAHSLILSLSLLLFWLFDERRDGAPGQRANPHRVLLGMAVAVAGGLLAAAQLIPPSDAQYYEPVAHTRRLLVTALRDAFFPLSHGRGSGWLGLALIAFVAVFVRGRRGLVALLLVSTGLLTLLFELVYRPHLRHAGYFMMTVLAVLWLERYDTAPARRWPAPIGCLLALSLVWSAAQGIRLSVLDYRQPFSGSRDAAAFLRTLDLSSAVVAMQPAANGAAVLPYLPIKRLWYPGHDAFGSYMPWDQTYERGASMDRADAFRRTRETFPEPWPLVYMTDTALERPEDLGLALGHATPEVPGAFQRKERYFIYTTAGVASATVLAPVETAE
jgi:hypothetical protein